MLLEKKIISSTCCTPEIAIDPEGIITIKGRSMHKNTIEFYQPIENWIDSYLEEAPLLTKVEIHLEYCNDITSEILVILLRKISALILKNKKFIITWLYEEDDDDIFALGEKISLILDIPLNFILI